jgi:ATP-binding cassette subfamily B protein
MRLYEPQTGKITVDGTNLSDYGLKSFRSKVAYVPQDVFLFSETIAENIAFGNESGIYDQEAILNAVQRAGLAKDIAEFPLGLDTILGERGVTLSGGQKQRVSIARALLRDADLYVFDDCLSAVDAATEMQIIRSFVEALAGKTAIIVSHRVAPLAFADHIIVLSHGRISEQGTRDALLNKNGDFAALYKKQSLETPTTV